MSALQDPGRQLASAAASSARGASFATPVSIALAYCALVVAVLARPREIAADGALYLDCGNLLLRGKIPYVDFVDMNPPLVMYVSALFVALSHLLSLSPILVFNFGVVALCGASIAAVYAIGRRIDAQPGAAPFPYAAFAFTWALLNVGAPYRHALGQREHLFLLAFVPFFLARFLAWRGEGIGRYAALTLGAATGVTACLKPHFLALILLTEGYWLLVERRWRTIARPEMAALVAAGLAYALHFLFVPAAMREALFGRWIPLVAHRYSTYDMPLSAILGPESWVCAALAILALWLGRRREGGARALLPPLGLFTAGGVALFVLQHKGWPYHAVPMIAGAGLVAALGLAIAQESERARAESPFGRALRVAPNALSYLLPAALLVYGARGGVPSNAALVEPIASAVDSWSRPGESVLIAVNSSVFPNYPLLVQKDRHPGSRYLWFFPLAFFHPKGGAMSESDRLDEQRFFRDVAEDLTTKRPRLVLMGSVGCQGCSEELDIERYLRSAPAIAEAMRPYVQVAGVDVPGSWLFHGTHVSAYVLPRPGESE